MFEATQAKQNTVSAKGQLKPSKYVTVNRFENPLRRILFIGNSITMHGPAENIGWYGDWGMAASCEENDYVHQTIKMFNEKYGPVDFCVAQLALWETRYFEGTAVLDELYKSVVEFKPEIVIVRIGENINRDKNTEINCKPFYDQMVKYFITDHCRQVIVTDCFWRIDVLDKIFMEVIDENGYTYCKINDLYLDEKTMAIGEYEHRGVSLHPSDYGMKKIAERIFEKIRFC